jgi:Fringe-like
MGAKMASSNRFLTMRNPFTRNVALAAAILVLLAVTFRIDAIDIRAQLISSATQSTSPQQALDLPTEAPAIPQGSSHGDEEAFISTHVPNCDIDIPHLTQIKEKYGLENKFQYLKRYVRFTRSPGVQRKSITKVEQNLLPKKFKTVIMNKKYEQETCPEPLEFPVPQSPFPATVNASDFMFAVSTTYKRFNNTNTTSINEWAYWLTDGKGASNGGKLLLMLLNAADDQLLDVGNRLRGLGIDVDVYHSDSSMEMAIRYLTLLPTLYNHQQSQNKKWLVICDDDTYFPSMHGLIAKLATFDHTQPLYIGTLSEDVNAVGRHGSQAFGGAGVFLSIPLAAKLNQFYDSCKTDEKVREADSGYGSQGDVLLRKCIYENSDVRLTNVWDLWQLDLLGDASGFYESGIKPLSVHHFKGNGWHLARPLEYSKIAHTCGEDCMMMRFQTADNFIISNGVSVAHYPNGIRFNLDQMERTFSAAPSDNDWNFDYMFGPQRRPLQKTGHKISWELQEASVNDDGSVLQVYIRKKDDWRWANEGGKPMNKLDGVIELVWIPS